MPSRKTQNRRGPTTLIEKATGETEPFSRVKFRRSLRRSGANPEEVERALTAVEAKLYRGMPTKEVFAIAKRELARSHDAKAARYCLKKSMLALGPTGYPFESIVGAILSRRGYRTRTGVRAWGRCISHEVDVVARRTDHRIYAECKYHRRQSYKSDVKVASARARDIQERTEGGTFDEFWLVTNTRFTSDAERFGSCAGLTMVSWDQPKEAGLRVLLEESRIYPVTCLTAIGAAHKRTLLERGTVMVHEIQNDPRKIDPLGLTKAQRTRVLREIDLLEELSNR